MNKKFFTLIAAVAMLFGAFTVNAQAIKDTDGAFYYVKLGTSYLTINAEGKTVQLAADNTAATLWSIEETEVTNAAGTQELYTFTSKDGKVLSIEAKATAKLELKAGISQWAVSDQGLYAYYTEKDFLAFKNTGGTLSLVKDGLNALASVVTIEKPVSKFLTAADLNGELAAFNVASLFDGKLENDMLDGVNLKAVALGATEKVGTYYQDYDEDAEPAFDETEGYYAAWDAAAGWMRLYDADAPKVGETPKYFGIDTIMQAVNPNYDGIFGFNFTFDTTYVAGTNDRDYRIGNGLFQIVRFVLDPSTDEFTMEWYDAPALDEAKGFVLQGKNVQTVSTTIMNTSVLTVSAFLAQDDDPETVAAPTYGTTAKYELSLGEPTEFAGETGVYAIYFKDGKKTKYIYAKDAAAFEEKETAPLAGSPAGQFYVVVGEDGKLKIAERNFDLALTGSTGDNADKDVTAAAVYEGGSEGAYRLDAGAYQGKDLFFVPIDVAAGAEKPGEYHYLGSLYINPADAAKNAYTLKVCSGVTGVDDLYTSIADTNLIANGEIDIEEAAKFKVLLNKFGPVLGKNAAGNAYEYNGEVGIGAVSLTDTLATANYKMFKQFTTDSLYFGYDKVEGDSALLIKKEAEADTIAFTFVGENKYMMTVSGDSVVLNFETGKLVQYKGGQPNYFYLEVVGAPNYADYGSDGHKVTSSDEDDNKRLIKDLEGIDALLNFFVEDEANYSLYFQRANPDNDARPAYYLTTQVGLTEEEKEDGNFFFLSNPEGFLGNTAGAADKFADGDARFVDEANGGLYKAVFVKGVFDADTVKIFGTNFAEKNVKDTLYKTLEGNPLVFAFATTPEGTVKAESAVNAESYLQVINNTLRWAAKLEQGHEFNVVATELIPTDNINPEAGFEVFTAEGGVIIKGAANQAAVITNVLGQTIAVQTIGSDYETISLPAGVAFITINGETVKAYVK